MREVLLAASGHIILGIDPGLAHTGWGIIAQTGSELNCLAYGCIATKASEDLPARLLKIHSILVTVVDKFKPDFMGIESVWFGKNTSAAFATGQARGVAVLAAAERGLTVFEYTPREVKLAIVGTGTAEKEQVQYMVKQILHLDQTPKPDHAADALACGLCCARSYKMKQLGLEKGSI